MLRDGQKDKSDLDRSILPDIAMSDIAEFCRRWKIVKLEVFGSALRDDFGPESDIDFLVTFDPTVRMSLFDLVHAEEKLSSKVGRSVDLVERGPIEVSKNWIRRRSILESSRTIYVTR